MPKLKTKSAVKKRFSLTANGKVKANFAYKSHLLRNKASKMKRHARGTFILSASNTAVIKKLLPYA